MRNCKYCCCFRLVPAGDGKKRGKKRKEKSGFFHIFVLSKKVERSKRKKKLSSIPPGFSLLLSSVSSGLFSTALGSCIATLYRPLRGQKGFSDKGEKESEGVLLHLFIFLLAFFFHRHRRRRDLFLLLPTSDLRDTSTAMASTPAGCPVSESNLVDVTHLPRALQWLLAIAVVLISGFFAGEKGERERRRRTRRSEPSAAVFFSLHRSLSFMELSLLPPSALLRSLSLRSKTRS
jgi:hypothetical protein